MTNLPISRRTVLKGLGTAVALPLLEAMAPLKAPAVVARSGDRATTAGRPAGQAAPRRMAFFYVPNGIHMADWRPAAEGAGFALPRTLEPLKPVQDKLLVLTGLTCDKARPNGDGPGDHARAMSAFLTGCQARKTHGADIRAGVSADQVAALKMGQQTKFASLELGCDRGMQSGNCDSGYSCAYSANLSWRGQATPMAKEIDPRLVFERLFSSPVRGEAAAGRAQRNLYQKSILDFVYDDANRLRRQLGAADQRKMDEYLTGVRELELRVARAGRTEVKAPPGVKPPAGVPDDYAEHIRLLCDLLVLAFQGDLTRVATFVIANEGSNRSYKFIGVSEGHHDLSHHGREKAKQEKLAKINRFHMEQFAAFLTKLNAIEEGAGTLLDNCMIVYGSGNSDGNRHNHDDLPILLAGKGGGTLRAGRHVRYPKDTPLTNLFLSMLDRMAAPVERLGDSTGRLPKLDG